MRAFFQSIRPAAMPPSKRTALPPVDRVAAPPLKGAAEAVDDDPEAEAVRAPVETAEVEEFADAVPLL